MEGGGEAPALFWGGVSLFEAGAPFLRFPGGGRALI